MRRILFAALVIAACTNDATEPSALGLSFSVVSGDGQAGTAGTTLAQPLVIKATDSRGKAIKNLLVEFRVTSGGGSANPASASTNAQGNAQTRWTLGTSISVPQQLEARAVSTGQILGAFTATALPGPAARLTVRSGDGQSAPHATAVPIAPAVLVADQYDNPVPGTVVSFTVTAGGGNVSPNAATTNDTGIATVGSWTLGQPLGTNKLTASVPSGASVTFTANATVGPVSATNSTVGADPGVISASDGAVRSTIIVTARDELGFPISGASVALAASGPSITLTQPASVTDSAGIARGALSSTAPGTKTVSATINATPVSQPASVTVTAGAPARLSAQAGDNQTGSVGRPVAVAPAVRLSDTFDNPVAGVTVTFTVTAGGGSASGTAQATDVNGIATVTSWTLGSTPGSNTLTATANGSSANAITFTATAVAGPPATLAVNAGNNQSAHVGTVVAVAPSVRITDSFGNPVSGVVVTFSVTGGGGSATGTTSNTDGSGVAMIGSWTLGSTPGTNTLTATVSGVNNAVTFTATALAGPPAVLTIRAGDNQTGYVATPLPIPPSVVVTDRFGNPVPGVAVAFAVTAGGGNVVGPNPVYTAGDGVATIGGWTLGQVGGANALTATAEGPGISGNPVTFTAQAIGDVWTRVAPLSAARAWLGAAAIDGKVYAVGGSGISAGRRLEVYDPATSTWTTRAPMPTWRAVPGVAAVNGILYVLGGWNGSLLATVEAYDPASDTWTSKAPLPTPRYMFAVAVYGGVLYAISGYTGSLVCPAYPGGPPDQCGWDLHRTPIVEAYDPTTDTWTTKAPLPTPRTALGAAELNGLIYAVGGKIADNGSWSSTVEAYDPISDTWTTKTPMPTGRFALGAGAVDGKLYAVGGEVAPNTVVPTVEAYDPASDTWTTKAPLPKDREWFGTAVSQGLLYVVGGQSFFNEPNRFCVCQVEYVDVYHHP